MRIAYTNTRYISNHTGGGYVHMEQFVKNAHLLGHEVWAYPGNEYSSANIIPTSRRLEHIKTMRSMDVFYVRLESRFPRICTWSLPPRRTLYRFPIVVWEFNTIPEEALFRGEPKEEIQKVVKFLQHYGKGCDLAVCVAEAAAEYVQKELGIANTVVVPNGSDPDLFRPEIEPVDRLSPFKGKLNIVWIGSAGIKYHDFETLTKGAKILWEKKFGDQVNFHIIGPNLVGKMADMPPNVFYWGAEEYSRLPEWLAGMDIGLYLSKGGKSAYGSPLKVFDYLASGLVVISSEHPHIRELFESLDQTDLMIPVEDAEYLAEKIIYMIDNPERRSLQSNRGRELIEKQYNWMRSVEITIKAIEKISK